MSRIKKKYLVLGTVSLIIITLLFFLSTITKNYLVKNSEKLIHRKLEIGEMHFNYAKVSLQVKNLTLFEANKTDTFLNFSELYINFDPWTLLQNEYSFSEIRLANPKITVIQNGDKFNFDSLKPKKDSVQVKTPTSNKVLKFLIRNIQLFNGEVKYVDVLKKNVVEMKNMTLNLPLIAWDNKESSMGVDFRMGEKGHVNVQAKVDNLNDKYQINLATKDIQIQPLTNYLTDYFELKSMNGLLASNLKIVGDMKDVMNVQLTGQGSVTDFSVLNFESEKLISVLKLTATIKDINLKTFHFGFGKIEAIQPNFLLVRDTKMTNFEKFILPYFTTESNAAAAAKASAEAPVTYSIDTLKVNNGLISFTDKTLNRPFSYKFNNLNLTMNNFSESADRIPFDFNMQLNDKGTFSGKTVWSMLHPMNLDFESKISRMDLMSFSPYSEFYIASPITQGWLNYDLSLKMTTTSLTNVNKVKIDELEFGKRTKDTSAMKVPVRLGLYLMKDKNDEIQFDIPVSGNPSDPQYKLGKIIWKAFGHMMLKAVVSPFTAMKDLTGTNPESLKFLPFDIAQDSLTQEQRNKMEKLASILKKKPDLILLLTQTSDPEKEKNQIAIQLTKKEYIETQTKDEPAIRKLVSELKDDDPNLLDFIRKTVPEVDAIGLQQACLKHTSASRIETRFQEVLAARNRAVSDFFVQKQGIPADAVQVSTADLNDLAQELRIPQFKIEVSLK